MRAISTIFRSTLILKICFTVCLFLCMIVADTFGKTSDRYQVTKPEQLFNKPVYTFVKTDKHGNIKWGVRHYATRNLK